MLEHEDMIQDKDMIKSVLQKIIDDMNAYEADRIMPEERKPKAVIADVKSVEISPEEEGMNDEEGLNPEILAQLMEKAETASPEGETAEDVEEGLDPEIAALVREKRKANLPK
jgi:hypothetical protein